MYILTTNNYATSHHLFYSWTLETQVILSYWNFYLLIQSILELLIKNTVCITHPCTPYTKPS
jgi:hypothetical protein